MPDVERGGGLRSVVTSVAARSRLADLPVLSNLDSFTNGKSVFDTGEGRLAAEDHSDLAISRSRDLLYLFLSPRPFILQWPFVAHSVSG